MSTLTEIEAAADQLPQAEKLRLMETLWDELSRGGGAELVSPHGMRRLWRRRSGVWRMDWKKCSTGSG